MKYRLIVFTINKEGNGTYSNDSNSESYKDYRIVLQDLKRGNNHCVELAYISGHDKWWCYHRNEQKVLTELGQAIEKFEKFFGVKAENFKLHKVTTVTEKWVKDEN